MVIDSIIVIVCSRYRKGPSQKNDRRPFPYHPADLETRKKTGTSNQLESHFQIKSTQFLMTYVLFILKFLLVFLLRLLNMIQSFDRFR